MKPKNSTEALQRLQVLVSSRTPMVWITTHEEKRVVDTITEWAVQSVYGIGRTPILPAGRQVWVWSHTKGFAPVANQREAYVNPKTGEPYTMNLENTDDFLVAIESAAAFALADDSDSGVEHNASIFVFLDAHPFLDPHVEDGPRYRRALRDLYATLSNVRSAAIFVSPVLPESFGDSEKEIEVLDWPLPVRDELEALVRGLRLPDRVPQNLNGNTDQLIDNLLGMTYEQARQALLRSIVECEE